MTICSVERVARYSHSTVNLQMKKQLKVIENALALSAPDAKGWFNIKLVFQQMVCKRGVKTSGMILFSTLEFSRPTLLECQRAYDTSDFFFSFLKRVEQLLSELSKHGENRN